MAAFVGLLDGCDRFARVLLRPRGGVLVQHLVRSNETLHQLDHDRPIGLGKEGTDAQRDLVADFGQPVVRDAVLHDVLQDALRLVADRRPAVVVERDEQAGRVGAEGRCQELRDRPSPIVDAGTSGVGADDVDGLNQVRQAAGLLRDDVAIELDNGRDLSSRGVAGLARADLADVRDLARRLDGHRRDVALFDVIDARQQVDTEHERQQQCGAEADQRRKRHTRSRTGAGRRRRCGALHEAHACWGQILSR